MSDDLKSQRTISKPPFRAEDISGAKHLIELERKYDAQFRVVFDVIRALMESPKPPRRRIGF